MNHKHNLANIEQVLPFSVSVACSALLPLRWSMSWFLSLRLISEEDAKLPGALENAELWGTVGVIMCFEMFGVSGPETVSALHALLLQLLQLLL